MLDFYTNVLGFEVTDRGQVGPPDSPEIIFMSQVETDVIGKGLALDDTGVDNKTLVEVNAVIRYHPVEEIGEFLRAAMNGMKAL